MKSKHASKVLIILILGIILLLVVRDILGFAFNKYIIVGFTIACFIIADTESVPSMLSFMFPLSWGLPYTYIFSVAIVIYWIKRRKIPKATFVLLLLFSTLEILASAYYPETNYIYIVKYLSVIAIFFTFLYDLKIDKASVVRFFYYGLIVLCAIIIISTIKSAPSNWLYLFSRGWFRFGEKQAIDNDGMMLKVNANTLAYYSVVGMSIGFYYIKNNGYKGKWILILSIALLTISGVFTVSRSWIIVAVICFFMFILEESHSLKGTIVGILATVGIFFIGYQIVQRTPEILQGILGRFNEQDITSAGARTDLFSAYNRAFWSNARFPLLGTGVTQYRAMIKISNSFHNMIQQIIVSYGIPCGIVFFAGMFAPLRRIKGAKPSIINWIPFVAVMLFTQTIQFINPEALMLPYIISIYILILEAEKKRAGGHV